MLARIEEYSAQSRYRRASACLLLASIGLPVSISILGGPDWLSTLSVLPGLLAYIALIAVTYHRLRNAALSGGWVVLMIMTFNFGPNWDAPGLAHLYLGDLVSLIPVLIGWVAPSNFGANPKTA